MHLILIKLRLLTQKISFYISYMPDHVFLINFNNIIPLNVFSYRVPSSVINTSYALGHMSSNWSYEVKANITPILEKRTLKLGKDR